MMFIIYKKLYSIKGFYKSPSIQPVTQVTRDERLNTNHSPRSHPELVEGSTNTIIKITKLCRVIKLLKKMFITKFFYNSFINLLTYISSPFDKLRMRTKKITTRLYDLRYTPLIILGLILYSSTLYPAWPFSFFTPSKPTFRIMLNPTGDAQHTGRVVGDSFERAITYSIAQAVKIEIESLYKDIKVLISRHPGQAITQNAIASYANRAALDLFIHISAYHQEDATKPYLTLYRFTYGFDFISKYGDIEFIPCTQGYLKACSSTKSYTNLVWQLLNTSSQQSFQLRGPYALPYKPLLGITAPALAFEIGIADPRALQPAVQALVSSINAIFKERFS